MYEIISEVSRRACSDNYTNSSSASGSHVDNEPARHGCCTHVCQGTPMKFIKKVAGPHIEEEAKTHQIATMHGSQPPAGHDAKLPVTARIARWLQRTVCGDFAASSLPSLCVRACIEYNNMNNNISRLACTGRQYASFDQPAATYTRTCCPMQQYIQG